jgi:hypothetical protein
MLSAADASRNRQFVLGPQEWSQAFSSSFRMWWPDFTWRSACTTSAISLSWSATYDSIASEIRKFELRPEACASLSSRFLVSGLSRTLSDALRVFAMNTFCHA